MSQLDDDEPVYTSTSRPTCSSSTMLDPIVEEPEVITKHTSARGKRRAPGAKVSHSDTLKLNLPKTTRKVKQLTEKSKEMTTPSISISAPNYFNDNASSSALSDDNDHATIQSDIPLLDQIAPVHQYDTLDPNAFMLIDYAVWCKAKSNFDNICIHINPEGNMMVDIESRYRFEKQPLKSFGQYIMVLNYNQKPPIILGINENLLPKYDDSDFLNAYVIKNSCTTNGSKNVHMVIVTTKKEYAVILFEKFLLCDKIGFRNLKNRDMWMSPENPLDIE